MPLQFSQNIKHWKLMWKINKWKTPKLYFSTSFKASQTLEFSYLSIPKKHAKGRPNNIEHTSFKGHSATVFTADAMSSHLDFFNYLLHWVEENIPGSPVGIVNWGDVFFIFFLVGNYSIIIYKYKFSLKITFIFNQIQHKSRYKYLKHLTDTDSIILLERVI